MLRTEKGVRKSNGYGDLPAVTVSCFWTNGIESRVGVVTPHFRRKMQLLLLMSLAFL